MKRYSNHQTGKELTSMASVVAWQQLTGRKCCHPERAKGRKRLTCFLRKEG